MVESQQVDKKKNVLKPIGNSTLKLKMSREKPVAESRSKVEKILGIGIGSRQISRG